MLPFSSFLKLSATTAHSSSSLRRHLLVPAYPGTWHDFWQPTLSRIVRLLSVTIVVQHCRYVCHVHGLAIQSPHKRMAKPAVLRLSTGAWFGVGSASACNSGARGRAGSRYLLYTSTWHIYWYMYHSRRKTVYTLVEHGLVKRAKCEVQFERGYNIQFSFLLRVMITTLPDLS